LAAKIRQSRPKRSGTTVKSDPGFNPGSLLVKTAL